MKINLDVLIKIGANRILIGDIKEGISKMFGNLLRFKLLMINIHGGCEDRKIKTKEGIY